jgi:hypothetical protein
MAAQGRQLETFDTGPNILVSEQPDQHERIEVAVEHDSLMGEQDAIELSVHDYKDGQEQGLPVIPRLIFTFTQERDVWRLTELTVAGHIPLTDPDYLKVLRKQQDETNEQMAQMRMNMIVGVRRLIPRAILRAGLCALCPASCRRKLTLAAQKRELPLIPGRAVRSGTAIDSLSPDVEMRRLRNIVSPPSQSIPSRREKPFAPMSQGR